MTFFFFAFLEGGGVEVTISFGFLNLECVSVLVNEDLFSTYGTTL